tara:strand:+ start:195 stop:377 length:183 start_codon:yes stop_codon:yes gene_type:complete
VSDNKADLLLRIGAGLVVGPIVRKYFTAWMDRQGMPLSAMNDFGLIFWSIVIYWFIGLLL